MIREPAVAGQFYPARPEALRQEVRSFLKPAESLLNAKAIVAPHAGYVYSGPVAGAVYGAVHLPSCIVVLGPNHTGRGFPLSLYPDGGWRTPLGMVEIDGEMNRRLQEECPALRQDSAAHLREHSLEVQIPFLQELVPGLRFSAICVGTHDYAALEMLGHALARVIQSGSTPAAIVCSSDMNHFEPADATARKDRMAIDMMIRLDARGLYRTVLENHISMCGFAPAVAAITASVDLGAKEGRLLKYANSGDVSGDYDRVVGYAALAFV